MCLFRERMNIDVPFVMLIYTKVQTLGELRTRGTSNSMRLSTLVARGEFDTD